jgi:WD40 repeat protein
MNDEVNEVKRFSYSSIRKIETSNPFGTGFIYQSHGTRVVTVSPDGKWIAFGGWDETIQVCELVEGGRSLTYRGHKDHVCALEWSPDGAFLASAGSGETTADIQVWEARTGQLIALARSDGVGVVSLAWSHDSAHLAFGTARSTVHLVKASTGETEFIYQEPTPIAMVVAVAWSPDGTRLASSGLDGSVQVWHADDGTNICRYLGHFGGVNALAWSPDGTSIASGGDDQTVQVWNASTREPVWTYRYHSQRVMVVGWSRDGQRIRSGSWDNTIRELDARNGAYLASFPFPHFFEGKAMPCAWNLDATTFAIGLEDRRVAVADTITGKLWFCRAPAVPVEPVGQRHQEQQADARNTARYGQAVKIWGGVEKEVVIYRGHSGAVKAVVWAPDNRLIASGGYDTTLQIWDASSGTLRSTCRGHLDPVVAVSWSPDGQRLVSGSLDTTAKIWDVATGQAITDYRGHSAAIFSLAWASGASLSSNETRIASGSGDGTVQVWDPEKNLTLTYRGHQGSIATVAWSPDGRFLASGGEDRTVQVWDATTGETIFLYSGHTGEVMRVAWSPDGKRIASSSDWGQTLADDGTFEIDEAPRVHLWETLTGSNPVFCDNDPLHSRISALAWSPDGRFVVTGDIFGQVQVYDAATGEAIARMFSHMRRRDQQLGTALALAWSSDGQRIAASFSSGLVYIWPAH